MKNAGGMQPGRCWRVQQSVNLQIPAINPLESALFSPTPELPADSCVCRTPCLTAARCRSCCSSDDQQNTFHSYQHFCRKAFSRQCGDLIYKVDHTPEALRKPKEDWPTAVYEQHRQQAPDNWPLPLTSGLGKARCTALERHFDSKAETCAASSPSLGLLQNFICHNRI